MLVALVWEEVGEEEVSTTALKETAMVSVHGLAPSSAPSSAYGSHYNSPSNSWMDHTQNI